MITNPRFPGSAARMADARLFTDYRANCTLIPQNTDKLWSEHQRHVHLQSNGAYMIAADRSAAASRSASSNCVDTMVPELSKRVYRWDGPVIQTQGISHAAGIGTGRMYLPGRIDLVGADPDIVAAATFPVIPGTFEARKSLYGGLNNVATVGPAQHNRYSAPYGK
jgi:hypothetical protein